MTPSLNATPAGTATPDPALLSAIASLPSAIHGPYEDAIVAAIQLAMLVIKDAPQEVKVQTWKDVMAFREFLGNLAAKVDFLHLFHPAATPAAKG